MLIITIHYSNSAITITKQLKYKTRRKKKMASTNFVLDKDSPKKEDHKNQAFTYETSYE